MQQRTCCCAIILVCLLAVTASAEPPPKYRVIFNCDGHATFVNAKGNLDHWIENVFAPLENTQVDALFWCDGAGGNTANYDSDVLELTGTSNNKVDPNLVRFIKEGNDPPKVIVREAHKRNLDVFFSFRINDVHDRFIPEEMATFKLKNPDWLIGERDYDGVQSGRTSVNFAVKEVRDLKYRIAEEVMTKYDFDGLEIDFMRSPPYFKPNQVDSHGHLLTEYLARIRKLLDDLAEKRGRKLYLAVRVDETLAACQKNGFRVKEWVDQDLIDYLIMASGVIDIDVEDFKRVAKGSDTLVYPCLYGWPSRYSPVPRELARGLALNYHRQGADGIYTFNWFPHRHNNSEPNAPYLRELLQQVGDPKEVARGDGGLMFAANRGKPDFSYPYNWRNVVLPASLSAGVRLPVPIEVTTANAVRADTQATLKIQAVGLKAAGTLNAKVNVHDVELTNDGEWFTGLLPAKVLKNGKNLVVLSFNELAFGNVKTLQINAVEICLK